jgi:hypothetical protein
VTTDSIISKVWSFCHTLRDDGVGYGDYLEQLADLDNLPEPADLAEEIIENIEAGLASLRTVASALTK